MNHLTARRWSTRNRSLETVTIPLRIFFQGQDDNPKYFDGRLNPYLPVSPAGGRLHRNPRSYRGGCAVKTSRWRPLRASTSLFAFVQTDMRIRYVAPIIGPLVILAVLGLRNLTEFARSRAVFRSGRRAYRSCGCPVLLPTWGTSSTSSKRCSRWTTLPAGSAATTISNDTRPEYAAFRYINERLPADAKVLGVFLGNRRYYCDRTLVFDGTLEAGPSSPPVRLGTLRTGSGKGLLAHRDRCGAVRSLCPAAAPARRASGVPGVSGRAHAHPVRARRATISWSSRKGPDRWRIRSNS